MTIIPMYPTITIERIDGDSFCISCNNKQTFLKTDSDVLFDESSLQEALQCMLDRKMNIEFNHPLYKPCNAFLYDKLVTRYCIYDCEFDRWLCLTDDGEIEWTTNYYESDVVSFDSEEDAEEMIPESDSDTYVIHKRHYLIEEDDED